MKIKEEDIHRNIFKTTYGHYGFIVVPFWLTNSLSTFMCLMNIVLHPYLDKFDIVFVDEILIYSKAKEEHENYLVKMLQLLREH